METLRGRSNRKKLFAVIEIR